VTQDSSDSPRCPRDALPLRAEGEYFQCVECHGALALADSVGALHPILTRIESSRSAALSAPPHGTGSGPCAACRAPTRALSFFEVPIDWCPTCGAVWLDGAELDQLRAQVERLRASIADNRADPYRTSAAIAAQLVVLGQVTCQACQRTVSVRESVYTSDGLMCVACGRERNGELPSAETEAEVAAWLDDEGTRRDRQRDWSRLREEDRARERERARREGYEDPIGVFVRWCKRLLGAR
jgi:Zn-finger nucleic acid-binding protein